MILVDANLLVYAYGPDSPEHHRANAWLEERLHGEQRVGLPWEATMAFVRLVSNHRMFPRAVTVAEAWWQVERWLSSRVAWVPRPTEDHAGLVRDLVSTPGLKTSDVPDVHLAAMAIGNGLRLASHDAGFARFAGMRWFDPLRDP
jgi:toxin-antitoxin system PIN domain toxin